MTTPIDRIIVTLKPTPDLAPAGAWTMDVVFAFADKRHELSVQVPTMETCLEQLPALVGGMAMAIAKIPTVVC